MPSSSSDGWRRSCRIDRRSAGSVKSSSSKVAAYRCSVSGCSPSSPSSAVMSRSLPAMARSDAGGACYAVLWSGAAARSLRKNAARCQKAAAWSRRSTATRQLSNLRGHRARATHKRGTTNRGARAKMCGSCGPDADEPIPLIKHRKERCCTLGVHYGEKASLASAATVPSGTRTSIMEPRLRRQRQRQWCSCTELAKT